MTIDDDFQPSFPITVVSEEGLTDEEKRILRERVPDIDPAVVEEWARAYKANDYSLLSPWAIFVDVTFIYDEQTAKWVERHCFKRGYIAYIDYDEELKRWIFHSLYKTGGYSIIKKDIAKRFQGKIISREPKKVKETVTFTEAQIEMLLFHQLRKNGKNPHRQVRCSAGIADIVTDDSIYEIKLKLNRDAFFKAVGQVLLYRDAINPSLQAVIVGRFTKYATRLKKHAESLGVEVFEWPIV